MKNGVMTLTGMPEGNEPENKKMATYGDICICFTSGSTVNDFIPETEEKRCLKKKSKN